MTLRDSTDPRIALLTHSNYEYTLGRRLFQVDGFKHRPNSIFAGEITVRHAQVLFERLRQTESYVSWAERAVCSRTYNEFRAWVVRAFDREENNFNPWITDRNYQRVQSETTLWEMTFRYRGDYAGGQRNYLSEIVGFLIMHDLWDRSEAVKTKYQVTLNNASIVNTDKTHLRYADGKATAEDELVAAHSQFFVFTGQERLAADAARPNSIGGFWDANFLGQHAQHFFDDVCVALGQEPGGGPPGGFMAPPTPSSATEVLELPSLESILADGGRIETTMALATGGFPPYFYFADGLPDGLQFDRRTRRLYGSLSEGLELTYRVIDLGNAEARSRFRLVASPPVDDEPPEDGEEEEDPESGPGAGNEPGAGGGGGAPPPPDDEEEDRDDSDDGGSGGGSDGNRPPRAAITAIAECSEDLCRARTGVPVKFEDSSTGSVRQRLWDFGDRKEGRAAVDHAWSAPGFYQVTLWVAAGANESTASLKFLVEASDPAGSCEAGEETLCLRDSRYSVGVDWWTSDGQSGAGKVVYEGTNDSGLFYFLSPGNNWEILIKVLNGCELNDHVWVYGASATTLGYTIRVADTVTGAMQEYKNDPGQRAPAITDNKAFPGGCDGAAVVRGVR